jgi:hypothetical protein
LMPATAAQMAGGQPSQSQLCDPAYNMNLGQKYLEALLAMSGGGVLQLAASYNAGPGNVMRWMSGKDDPLMFIETMPAQETRAYVKRVMTYYWIYSHIAGKSSKSLEDTARGYWPRYETTYRAPAQPPQTPVAAPAVVQSQPAVATAPITAQSPQPGLAQPQIPAVQPPQQEQAARSIVVSDASTPH